jgi:hypothetical protein
MKTPKQGAQTIIYCAVTDNLEEDEEEFYDEDNKSTDSENIKGVCLL